jgi:hypothetical protein
VVAGGGLPRPLNPSLQPRVGLAEQVPAQRGRHHPARSPAGERLPGPLAPAAPLRPRDRWLCDRRGRARCGGPRGLRSRRVFLLVHVSTPHCRHSAVPPRTIIGSGCHDAARVACELRVNVCRSPAGRTSRAAPGRNRPPGGTSRKGLPAASAGKGPPGGLPSLAREGRRADQRPIRGCRWRPLPARPRPGRPTGGPRRPSRPGSAPRTGKPPRCGSPRHRPPAPRPAAAAS